MVIVGMLIATYSLHNLGPQTSNRFHRVLVEIGTNVHDWLAEDTLINCTHLATVTRTSGATIQQSASRQNPSFGSLERALYGCPVYTRPFQHSRANVDIRVSRGFPIIKRTRVLRSSSESLSITMCLKCALSERNLSLPQMRRRYLQASCCLHLPVVHSALAPQCTSRPA